MRVLSDLASTIDEPMQRRRVIDRGKRVLAGCSGRLQEDDFLAFPISAVTCRLDGGLAPKLVVLATPNGGRGSTRTPIVT